MLKIKKIFHTYFDELRRSGTTILFTTHFLDDIEDWATRLIIPIKGSIVYDCSLTQIVENLYHLKIEIPYPERTLEFVKTTGLVYKVSDREIYIFIRKSEIPRIGEIIYCGIPEVQEGLRITRPTLEEGYLNFLRRIKR